MINSLKDPMIATIKNIKKSQFNQFLLENLNHIQWFLSCNNSAYKLQWILTIDPTIYEDFKIKKLPIFLVKKTIFHHCFHSTINTVALIQFTNEPYNNNDPMIILDYIVDYGNIGSIIRNSFMMGIKNFIIINDFNPFYSKVIDSCRGLIFKINIWCTKDYNDPIEFLLSKNYHILISNFHGNSLLNYTENYSTEPMALLMGNETKGYDEIWNHYNNKSFWTIPMVNHPQCDSMNVSVAAGIFVYTIWGRKGIY